MSQEGSQNQEEEVVEEPPYEHQIVLDYQVLQEKRDEREEGLMQLYRVPDGSTFAYGKLIADEKELVDIVDINRKSETFGECILDNYAFLRSIKLNINSLTNIDRVARLKYLIELQANENQITSLGFMKSGSDKLEYLQKVSLQKNQLTELPQLQCNSLKYLDLEENQISTCGLEFHETLRFLNLNKNKIKNGHGICGLKKLEVLLLQENKIRTLDGMGKLPCLRKLDLTGNQMQRLHSLTCVPEVKELILDGNPISSLNQFRKIKQLKNLESLSMVGCPFAEEKGDDFKREVLIEFHSVLPNLKTINGEDWSKDDLEEMNAEIKAREEAKLEADAEEKEPVEPENDSAVEDSQDEGGNPVPKQTMDEDQLEALRYQFMDMDENKDGKISKLELRKIMKEMGEDYTIKQCNRMIKNVDKDGDGMISFEEFCKSVEAPPEKEEEEAEE